MMDARSLVLRCVIGCTFAVAATYKLVEIEAFGKLLASSLPISVSSRPVLGMMAGTVAGTELAIAYGLLASRFVRLAALAACVFLCTASLVAAPVLARGGQCHCMWDWVPMHAGGLASFLTRNGLLLLGAATLVLGRGETNGEPRLRFERASQNVSLVGLAGLACWQLWVGDPPRLTPEQFLKTPPSSAAPITTDGITTMPGIAEALDRVSASRGDFAVGQPEQISGRVIDAALAPLQSVVVRLTREGTNPIDAVTDGEGSFSVNVHPGLTYTLECTLEGMSPHNLRDVCAGNHYRIVLTKAASVTGAVLDANQRLALGAVVTLSRLSILDEPPQRFVAREGRYSFQPLESGRYALVAEMQGHQRLYKSFSLSTGESRIEDLRLGFGESPVAGRVVDDESSAPISGATVSLSSDERDPSIRSGIDGSFVLHAPPPGRHMVHFQADGYARTVLLVHTTKDGGFPPVEARLGRGVAVRGQVTASGTPVPGAIVDLRAVIDLEGGASWHFDYRSTADVTGSFAFEHIPSRARCLLRVDGHEKGATTMELDSRDGANFDFVSVDLRDLCEVHGTLVDESTTGGITGRVMVETERPELPWSNVSVAIPGRFVARVPCGTPLRLVATADDGREVMLRIADAREAPHDLVLRFERGLALGGTISGERGEPVDAIVAVSDGLQALRVVESSGGRFTVPGLPSRPFTVIAWQKLGGRSAFGARANGVVPGERDLALVLPSPVAATGRLVKGAAREPIVGARVWCYFLADGTAACEPVVTTADGSFLLHVPKGERLGIRVATTDQQADVGAIVSGPNMAPVEVELPQSPTDRGR